MDRVALLLACFVVMMKTSYGSEIKIFTFFDEKKAYDVKTEWDSSIRIGVSSHCQRSAKSSCLALQKLDAASMRNVQAKGHGSSANPGTLICENLGGRVIIGRDSSGNENSFCKFKDQSLIDCGTLTWYGRLK